MLALLQESMFENCADIIQGAIDAAPQTVQKWGAPVDKFDSSASGLHWSTYKAVCRREGRYSSGRNAYDFNQQL